MWSGLIGTTTFTRSCRSRSRPRPRPRLKMYVQYIRSTVHTKVYFFYKIVSSVPRHENVDINNSPGQESTFGPL